jgi:hypothetical protein
MPPHLFPLEETNGKEEFHALRSYLLSPVYRTYSTEITDRMVATSRFIAHQAWIV